MTAAWVGFGSALLVAVITVGFGIYNAERSTRNQRAEELRRRRVEVYAGFCASVIEYRRAQLHRWHVGARVGPPEMVEKEAPEVAEDVRRSRSAAWGRFYEVLMICNDDAVERQARTALETARSMKQARSSATLDALSDQVHAEIAKFARLAGATVLTDKPSEAAPPLLATLGTDVQEQH